MGGLILLLLYLLVPGVIGGYVGNKFRNGKIGFGFGAFIGLILVFRFGPWS